MDNNLNENINDFDEILDRLDDGLVAFASIDSILNYPTIKPNDIIAIRRSEGYAPGDFIFYINSKDFYVRRIIKLEYNKVYVKGDNEENVFILLPDQVLGKVISLERGLTRISLTVINNKMKLNRIINKGLRFIKKNYVTNDEYLIPIVEKNKKKEVDIESVLPLDGSLQKELACFKSPAQKVREFYDGEEED